ncbi:HD family phosphohydrolase [Oceanivirga miroungae]|uniref:Metal dependent phosphohydrolase n=1 Tax=Oceanivirga miroungae TaxID=1130046 RepID=A0A6I8MBU5_9FUSO|nr:HDIG domain-containing metalloprotein [Oceanivirga miroungae]VWL85708.1 metal dependent phosphohydrolase [Oceanivirga miroungae]
MKIKIFRKELYLNIALNDIDNKKSNEKKTDRYKNRISLLLLFFILFSLLTLVRKINFNEYKLGSKLTTNIVSSKSIEYSENILDDLVRDKIYREAKPVYDKNKEIEDINTAKFVSFLEFITKIDLNNIENADNTVIDQNINKNVIKKYLKDNNLNINSSDVLKLIKGNNNIEYYLNLVKILSLLYENGVTKDYNIQKLFEDNNVSLNEYETNILKSFISPNLSVNAEKTKKSIDDKIELVKNSKAKINKSDVIAKKGDVITKDVYRKLSVLGLVDMKYKASLIFNFVFVLIFSFVIFFYSKKLLEKGVNSNGFYPTLIMFILINILNQILTNDIVILLFLIPFASISIISSMLTKDKNYSIAISLLTNYMLAPNLEWFLAMGLISLIAITNNEKLKNRIDLVKNGFKISVIQAFLALIWGLVYSYDFTDLALIYLFSLLSGFLTGMICLGLAPYFENTFNILTEIKLLELGDYSFPLLKRLLLEAPGTFYHSIMVGALSEQAAQKIGANPTLARVGAYYHDIGKLKRPLYFVENQGGIENLHNKLNPSVSALILTSHPRDGFILAKQYGLPNEILQIIVEHHGTTAVQYFYYKAVEIGEKVSEYDFRYIGPKPSTKEAAIVMLADSVEAAVRANSDKSREGIEETIRYLIKYKMDDNQLINSGLTFTDIEKIVEAFLTVLKAAYHERIKYPKINDK